MAGFILTLLMLVLSYVLKTYLNRQPNKVDKVKSLSEVPVDIMFTSTAFIIAYLVAKDGKLNATENTNGQGLDMNNSLLYFVVYVLGTIGVILLWRKCEDEISKPNNGEAFKYIGIEFLISVIALFYALIKLYGVV